MQLTRPRRSSHQPNAAPIPFPRARRVGEITSHESTDSRGSASDVMDALQTVSRRITDLARELKCLGYFDDGHNDRPRAA
jgi:hypothetical protein